MWVTQKSLLCHLAIKGKFPTIHSCTIIIDRKLYREITKKINSISHHKLLLCYYCRNCVLMMYVYYTHRVCWFIQVCTLLHLIIIISLLPLLILPRYSLFPVVTILRNSQLSKYGSCATIWQMKYRKKQVTWSDPLVYLYHWYHNNNNAVR